MKPIGIIFLLIGAILFTIAGFTFYNQQQFLDKAHVASGRVIEVRKDRSSKGGRTFYPIVEFIDQQGKSIRFNSSFSSSPPAYEVGELVEVYYDYNNPYQAEIKGFFPQWLAVLISSTMGLIFSTIGIVILSISGRVKKKTKVAAEQWPQN
ncbi:DUF3592 domain-containing protein [Rhodocytophaga aerolata]|uniref:DUF3592 domain-containing protein n=1 Tax=Rhodocytophaga aerolata TaxID=455078 RepID=A0ABT8RHA0_9BACT|nr:DUF3592 domain-containing protein [Rhodocytophaga aerolata]MDO1451473.1 DUF3592 domain-containing protein [Rhodocytophaga aerolata]